MVQFKTGELFPLPAQQNEGVVFSVEQYTMLLIYYFRRPTQEEIQTFKEGDVSIALAELKNTLFVISRFGNLSWMDTPYSTQLSSTEKSFPALSEKQGFAVDCFLVDQESNLLTAHRLIHLDNAFSKKFANIMMADQKKEGFTREGYAKAVQEVYANYSTRDLLGLSMIRTRINAQ